MGLTSAEIHNAVKAQAGDAVVSEELDVVDPFLVVRPEAIESVAFFCRDDKALAFDLLSLVSGVDYPDDKQCLSAEADDEMAHLPSASPVTLLALATWILRHPANRGQKRQGRAADCTERGEQRHEAPPWY